MPDPEYRLVNVEPIGDFLAICETMDAFDIGHPEDWAALEVAKAALANREVWTGEKIPVPATEAEIALRELVNHPLLLDLFGNLEDDCSTKESTRLFGYAKAWVELRDATLAALSPTEAAPDA